jgi:type VI protein secretion system component VasF
LNREADPMTDAFSDLVMPIFRKVIDLKDRLSWLQIPPSLEDVKQQTRGWIEEAERLAQADSVLKFDFGLAKFGFVAWIDEVLTYSKWGESVGWGKPTAGRAHGEGQADAPWPQVSDGSDEVQALEWEFYGTNLRAGLFYERAEEAYEAVSQSRASTDPLEVYLLCVALGFQGDYRIRPERLRTWVERMYTKLTETSPMAAKPFADEPSAATVGLRARQGPELLLRVSILTAITAVATLVGYLASVHSSLSVQSPN